MTVGTLHKFNRSGNGQPRIFKRNTDKKSGNGNLHTEIITAIQNVGAFGSVEIYIQDHHVTQITARRIKKTKHAVESNA